MGIDSLAILTGVDFNTQVLAPEELDGGQCLCLEGVESQLDALNIIVTSAGEVGAAQNALLENGVGALKVEHFGEFSFPAEDLIPSVKIGQGAGEPVEEEVVLSRGSDSVFHRIFEQSHNDFVGRQLSDCEAFLDDVGPRPARLTLGAEQFSGGEVCPAELSLSKLAHGSFSGAGSSENKDDIGLWAGLSRVTVVEHDLGGGRHSHFVDVPFPVRRRQLVLAGGFVGEMTVQTGDSPGLVTVGV